MLKIKNLILSLILLLSLSLLWQVRVPLFGEWEENYTAAFTLPTTFPNAVHESLSGMTDVNISQAGSLTTTLESILFPSLMPNDYSFPKWLVEYIAWHKKMRAEFPDDQLFLHPNRPLLLIRSCQSCGGLQDRWVLLLSFLYQAHVEQRVLLFKWYHPHYELESFLQPRDDVGFNWTVPNIMETSTADRLAEVSLQTNKSIKVPMRYKNKGMTPPQPIPFAHLWDTFFRPSDRLRREILHTFHTLNLVPRTYHALHLRVRHPAQYGKKDAVDMDKSAEGLNFNPPPDANATDADSGISERRSAIRTGKHALRCIQQQRQQHQCWSRGKVYIYSDSQDLVEYLIKTQNPNLSSSSSSSSLIELVARKNSYPNYHLDTILWNTTTNTTTIHTEDVWHSYASTFVDLYVAVFAKCLGIGLGNFGMMAYSIGQHSCVMQYKQRKLGTVAKVWGFQSVPNATECLGVGV